MSGVKVLVNLGERLFSFSDFDNWCDTASCKFMAYGVTSEEVICIDAVGRVCQKGKEFMRAREERAFPVIVYRALCG